MSPENQRCLNVSYLAPTRRADTNCEHGEEPRVDLAEPGEECEDGAPYADEEGSNEDEDIDVLELVVPQKGPVLSISLGKGGLEM